MGEKSYGVGTRIHNYIWEAQSARQDLEQSRISGRGQIYFPQNPNIADYIGNKFYDMRTRLSDNDTKRFDMFLSAFGYAVDEPLSASFFSGRQYHNYIQATNVVLKKSNIPMMLLNGVINDIQNGVRIWHVAPDIVKMWYNPKV